MVHNLSVQNDDVGGVLYKQDGRDVEVNADIVALGANAIFNAHILLSAGDKNYYTGRGLSDQRGTFVFISIMISWITLAAVPSSRLNGYMLYDGDHRKDYAASLIESFNDPLVRNEAGKWRKISKFKFVFEDLPNDNNRVTLTDNPILPRIEYGTHDKYVDRAMEKLREKISTAPFHSCLSRVLKWITIFKNLNSISVPRQGWEKMQKTV